LRHRRSPTAATRRGHNLQIQRLLSLVDHSATTAATSPRFPNYPEELEIITHLRRRIPLACNGPIYILRETPSLQNFLERFECILLPTRRQIKQGARSRCRTSAGTDQSVANRTNEVLTESAHSRNQSQARTRGDGLSHWTRTAQQLDDGNHIALGTIRIDESALGLAPLVKVAVARGLLRPQPPQ
jgi:hypothetical protein